MTRPSPDPRGEPPSKAQAALRTIRQCVASNRVRLTRHFRTRLVERGLVWPDVLAVFDQPADMRSDGVDDAGRPRWIVGGRSAGGELIPLICAIGRDDAGQLAVFITIYWND